MSTYKIPASVSDEEARRLGVEHFTQAMIQKLAAAREAGCAGWNDPALCDIHFLAGLLVRAVRSGDLISIGNYAMMLYCRAPTSAAIVIKLAFAMAAEQVVAEFVHEGMHKMDSACEQFDHQAKL